MNKLLQIHIVFILILFCACNRIPSPKEEIENTEGFKPESSVAYQAEDERYPFPNTKEGYHHAGMEWKNPLEKTEENYQRGKELYLSLCKHCHGKEGDSDAPMIDKDKYPTPPKFAHRLPKITEGHMFHSITYGKNQMPANSNDFSHEQKWLMILYIQKLAAQTKNNE
jgi:mono/diheme cytochrome c family protein